MVLSPNSRHKSRLIREMARDLNKTNHSCASSTGSHHGTVSDDSTMTDFNPEKDGAYMSTRQFDLDQNLSQRLPELRDTAKKYGRWGGGRQENFQINTSAIGRAFPDFSQGGSSDDSFSIELGRGPKTKQRTPSRVPRPEYSDNVDSPVVKIGNFEILNTPPMKGQVKTVNRQHETLRNSVRKESQSKRSSTPQKENIPPPSAPTSAKRVPDYVSGASRTSSGEQRRTLAELHARVADESDGSFISDERPPTVTFAKNSRFASNQSRNSPLSKVSSFKKQHATDALVNALQGRRQASQTPSKLQSEMPMGSIPPYTPTPNATTQQSFLIPNMPDISELVSGTFKNGTPVFSASGKIQSRLSSHGGLPTKDDHGDLDGVPVDDEEKNIYLSLELLQDKVAALEMEKAEFQQTIDDLQRNNYQLQAENDELEKRRRTDSGFGDSGNDADYARDNRKLISEKTRLEAQIISMQNRLDANDRMISNQELRLKTNTVERDQAVKQLAEAWYTSEQLNSENDTLRQENASLRARLEKLNIDLNDNTRQAQQTEESLRKKLNRRDAALADFEELTKEITRQKVNIQTFSASHQQESHISRANKTKDNTATRDNVTQPPLGQAMKTSNKQTRGRQSDAAQDQPRPQSKQRLRSRSRSLARNITQDQYDVQDQYEQETSGLDASEEMSFDQPTKTIHKDINIDASHREDETHQSNYSSILGHGEMQNLRNHLAELKVRSQTQHAAYEDDAEDIENDTVRSVRSARSVRLVPGERPVQRKASVNGLAGILKNRGTQDQDLTGRMSIKSNGQDVEDEEHTTQTTHRRTRSDTSVHTKTRRRVVHAEEMTSAFLVPDITLHGHHISMEHPVLSASARCVLDKLASHDGRNCTVCSRVASFETKDNTISKIETNYKVRIEKPIPVSDRMPVTGPYEDEPTMRPLVAPGLALATVMKGLQDELAHLKMQLAQYQAVYNKQDPSLGMRKRKAVNTQIQSLMKAIDIKADQIYALYDVLEGQKQSGQMLTEEEVEITLQSIGVSAPNLEKGNQGGDDDESDGDSDMDLPWEGIEDTTASTKGMRRQSWN